MKITIEDAYWSCCGEEFRSKEKLFRHKLDRIDVHKEELFNQLMRSSWLWLYAAREKIHDKAFAYVEEKMKGK